MGDVDEVAVVVSIKIDFRHDELLKGGRRIAETTVLCIFVDDLENLFHSPLSHCLIFIPWCRTCNYTISCTFKNQNQN